MKKIKYTILYCVCENFCDSFHYGSGLSISDPHHFAPDADSTFILMRIHLQPLAYKPSTAQ
jgi:hypothetical protein